MVLENFLNGAMGFTTYLWDGLDGLDMKYLAEAMRMVVPVEDIIVDGAQLENIASSDKGVKVCGLKKGNEVLILVSDYVRAGVTKTTITVPVELDSPVVDMATLKKIGVISREKNEVEVTLDKDRAQLLYFGSRKF